MKCHENVTKVINNFNSLSIRQTVKKKKVYNKVSIIGYTNKVIYVWREELFLGILFFKKDYSHDFVL